MARICLILRKAYGGAYIVMDSKAMGNDLCLAWPSAEVAVMGAEGAVQILHRRAEGPRPGAPRRRVPHRLPQPLHGSRPRLCGRGDRPGGDRGPFSLPPSASSLPSASTCPAVSTATARSDPRGPGPKAGPLHRRPGPTRLNWRGSPLPAQGLVLGAAPGRWHGLEADLAERAPTCLARSVRPVVQPRRACSTSPSSRSTCSRTDRAGRDSEGVTSGTTRRMLGRRHRGVANPAAAAPPA